MFATKRSQNFMSSDGLSATTCTELPTDNMPSSCDGPIPESPGSRYKISQIVVTQTQDFRWKVAIFSPRQCELVRTFQSPDAMGIWLNDVARLHTWERIEGVGL